MRRVNKNCREAPPQGGIKRIAVRPRRKAAAARREKKNRREAPPHGEIKRIAVKHRRKAG